ncbi:hypothetical protein ACRALDRAFT_211577 [Sodiomyces alcalophilus JCM 7366]|uniref:uncharacterized protein n=1 Tax=Sodiomyces alcalophilus JCM 7366 TaxID=591952 RepID=UPI0039B61778
MKWEYWPSPPSTLGFNHYIYTFFASLPSLRVPSLQVPSLQVLSLPSLPSLPSSLSPIPPLQLPFLPSFLSSKFSLFPLFSPPLPSRFLDTYLNQPPTGSPISPSVITLGHVEGKNKRKTQKRNSLDTNVEQIHYLQRIHGWHVLEVRTPHFSMDCLSVM